MNPYEIGLAQVQVKPDKHDPPTSFGRVKMGDLSF